MKKTKLKQTFSKAHKKYLGIYYTKKIFTIITQIVILIAFVTLWEILADKGLINVFFFSSPSRIFKLIQEMYKSGELWHHASTTLNEALIGFAIATGIGFLVAVILWSTDFIRNVLEPYIVILNALPKIALGPMIIIWFGAGSEAIIFMCIITVVIITTMNILQSFINCDKQLIAQAKSMGANKLQLFRKVVLPNSIKDIVSTLKINVGLSWIGAIMGEYMVSRAGLGYLLDYASYTFDTNLMMSATVVLCFFAALMYFIVALFEKLVKKMYQ